MDKEEKIVVKVDPEIADLIPGFLKNREKDIKTMESCIKESNFEQIERLGHSMKGSGAGYGFDGISEIGKFIEIGGKEKDTEKIKKGIEELKNYLNRVEIVNG
ncbi:MAG: Hpt domain-containing protein [candidate division WOR-3 bacterium]|jgi:HPt (histidine-containing phosphotransfer) domain-containing protein